MNPQKIAIKELRENGYRLDREGANHMVFVHEALHARITISRSSHFDDGDLQMIRSEIKRNQRKGLQ